MVVSRLEIGRGERIRTFDLLNPIPIRPLSEPKV